MDTTIIKTLNNTFVDYSISSTRKALEFQTEMLNGWIKFNKTLYENLPIKNLFDSVTKD